MKIALCDLLLGLLAADFVTGFVHWAEENYGSVRWPILGKYIIAPNRVHHAEPRKFLEGGYWRRNWTTIAPAAAALLMLLLCGGLSTFSAATCFFASQANEIHAWAHQKCSPPIRLLQETILQGPAHHSRHHQAPYDRRYCVITPFLNPLLDAAGFWSRLEMALATMGVKKTEDPTA